MNHELLREWREMATGWSPPIYHGEINKEWDNDYLAQVKLFSVCWRCRLSRCASASLSRLILELYYRFVREDRYVSVLLINIPVIVSNVNFPPPRVSSTKYWRLQWYGAWDNIQMESGSRQNLKRAEGFDRGYFSFLLAIFIFLLEMARPKLRM